MQLTSNLAYLLGSLRDGSICRFKSNQGKICSSVTFYSKSREWLKILQIKILDVFERTTKIVQYGNKTPYLRIYSKELVNKLNGEFQCPLKTQIGWITPLPIKASNNPEIIKNYIAGFWDAEGGANLKSQQIALYLSWNGNDCPPLEDLKAMLEKFEITLVEKILSHELKLDLEQVFSDIVRSPEAINTAAALAKLAQ